MVKIILFLLMTATIATFRAMLIQQLEPKIQDQIDWLDVLLEDFVNADGVNPAGIEVDLKNEKFEITALTGGMSAYAGSETGALIASDIGLQKMEVPVKFTTASFQLEHAAIQATIKDQASLERGTSLYGMECRRAMLRTKGRLLRGNGTGISGVLPAGVVTGTTVTISGKAAGTTASQARYGVGTQYLQVLAKISLGTEADFAAGTQIDRTITAVTSDTTFTIDSSATFGAASGANNRGGTNADTWYLRFQ